MCILPDWTQQSIPLPKNALQFVFFHQYVSVSHVYCSGEHVWENQHKYQNPQWNISSISNKWILHLKILWTHYGFWILACYFSITNNNSILYFHLKFMTFVDYYHRSRRKQYNITFYCSLQSSLSLLTLFWIRSHGQRSK